MQIDRRRFLMTALTAPAVASAQKSSPPLLDRGFAQVSRLADGVYATIANPAKGPQCASNGAVVAGRDATLIIEGHFFPEGAELEIEVARMVSKAPIRAAVNTHYHLDHTFGNSAYQQTNIPIIAHERAPALMKENYAALQHVDKKPLLAPWEKRAAGETEPVQKQRATTDLQAMQWEYQAIDRVTLAYPSELLRDADFPKQIDLGGLNVILEHPVGHTPTDVLVRVPQRDIVFTGDLLFEKSYPVTFDADMLSWRKVLERLAKYPRGTRFVPGHGPVCGVEVVHEFTDLFDDLHNHADQMRRSGASAEEATRRYTPPTRFAKFDTWPWDWCVGSAMRKYYAQDKV
jgi:cyclase